MGAEEAFRNRNIELMERLIRLTEEGVISWTDNDGTSFSYTSPTATVVIESVDKDGQQPFALRLINSDGTELEHITTPTNSWGQRAWDKPLESLYGVARRDVLNVNNALSSLLKE